MTTPNNRELVQAALSAEAKTLVTNVVLRHRQRRADAKNGEATGDRTGVGLFIPLPDALADQFPSLAPEDNSTPHVTLLYVGEVPKEKEEAFLRVLEILADDLPPVVKAKLHQLDYFEHADKDRTIAHMSVKFSCDMARFKYRLISGLQELGIAVQDSFPTSYFPHVTLGYIPGLDMVWKGQVPRGMWSFDRIQVWGLPDMYEIVFGAS